MVMESSLISCRTTGSNSRRNTSMQVFLQLLVANTNLLLFRERVAQVERPFFICILLGKFARFFCQFSGGQCVDSKTGKSDESESGEKADLNSAFRKSENPKFFSDQARNIA